MTKFQKGDRFSLGGFEGEIVTVGTSGAYNVRFDGHVYGQGSRGGQGPMSNNFRADWFDERAEKVEPPRPSPQEFFATLVAGDKFTFAPAHIPEAKETYVYVSTQEKRVPTVSILGFKYGGGGSVGPLMFINSDILTKLD